ncbi:S8 family serine peptidase [Brumicola blandensis]|uniref:S8 family serine peptidase n=1 Tax=Brumicola blandensis TaxID=3075611 RepID=A0AAW8R909_9ALTE|nr:S8 family serine peptidase [Alteromonas sp. W409]MDT0583678.1 S8 family serine peptidase [Alteromonas sp. W409]
MSKLRKNLTVGLGSMALSVIALSVSAATQSQMIEVKQTPSKAQQSKYASKRSSGSAFENFGQVIQADAKEERYIVTFKEQKGKPADNDRFSSGKRSTLRPDQSKAMMQNGKLNQGNAYGMLKNAGAKPIKAIKDKGMVAAKMSKATLNKLRNDPNVADISVDHRRSLMAETTPYGIPMVQGNLLSQNNQSARKVCVIDTGFNLGHPDLGDQNNGVTGNANNNQVGNWFNDGNGHGTHVAGTISALSNNEGVVGVYPGVDLHIVKIFNDQGQWTFSSDIIDGIQQCANAGANVVNMSLGGGGSSTAERNAMQGFVDDGIMLVAAAGNSGNSSLSYPASYDAVISVAAVGSNESRASYSQYNSQVEIAGPGSAVQSTWPVNTYNTISGTSMATPHVAGAAALVWSFFPSCSNEQIRTALNVTAKDKGSAGRDNFYGFGIVKARDAYDYLNANGCDGNGGGTGGGGGGGGGVDPFSGQLTNLSGNRNAWKRYTWNVPNGVSRVTVTISGGSGDADLYMKLGSQPETNSYDCRPYKSGNNETCTFTNTSGGTWHVGIRGYSRYSGVTMSYSYE